MQTKGRDQTSKSEIKDVCCSSVELITDLKLTNSVSQIISEQLYFCHIFNEELIS
jgi:hypothetical protein